MTDVNQDFTARLKNATAELLDLEYQIKLGKKLDAALLTQFRAALDNMRMTALVVEVWQNVQPPSQSTPNVTDYLSEERVRRLSQMARDLQIDLENCDVTIQTPGIRELTESLNTLHSQLKRITG